MKAPQGKRRCSGSLWNVFLLVWCLVECLLFGGLHSPWPNLVLLYKEEGVYSHLCRTGPALSLPTPPDPFKSTLEEEETDQSGFSTEPDDVLVDSCTEQEEAFQSAYTVGIVTAPPLSCAVAHLNHVQGIRVTRLVTLALLSFGVACLALTSQEFPWAVIAALPILGAASTGLYITSCQVAYKFKQRAATASSALTGALFAGGGLVPLALTAAHNHGVTMRQSFEILGPFLVLIVISTYCFLPKTFFAVEDLEVDVPSTSMAEQEKHLMENGRESSREPHLTPQQLDHENGLASAKHEQSSLLRVMASPKFYLLVLWRLVHMFLFTFTRGVLNAWLQYVTKDDQSKVNHLTDVFSSAALLSFPLALLGGILFDVVTNWLPDKIPYQGKVYISSAFCLGLTTLVGTAICACAISERVDLAYFMMFLLAAHVCFLFSFASVYIRRIYREELFGIVLLVASVASTPFNLLQVPLFSWCQSDQRNWSTMFWILLLLSLLTLVHPIYLLKKARSSLRHYQPVRQNEEPIEVQPKCYEKDF